MMTSNYRLEFVLSTIHPDGDIADARIQHALYRAFQRIQEELDVEILWSEFSNTTQELLDSGYES